jgi:homoserine kinase type II
MLLRDIPADTVDEIIAHYDIGPLTAPPHPAGGTANANVRITTAAGEYFLRRRNPKYAAEPFVAFDHALMAHLTQSGLPTPREVLTRDGAAWVRHGDDVYEMFHYQPGGPHDRNSVPQIAAAGRALAAYHHATSSFRPLPGKDWPRYDDPWLIREGIAGIEAQLRHRMPARDIEYLSAQVTLLERELPDDRYHALPKLVVHGDYHPGNLLFQNDEVVGIFDLDWATFQPRARDLADGVFLFAGERDTDIDASDIFSLTQTWRPSRERARVFVDAYLGSGRLTEDESDALPLTVRARWLYCRVAGIVKVAPERRIEYFRAGLLEPLRVLDSMQALF